VNTVPLSVQRWLASRSIKSQVLMLAVTLTVVSIFIVGAFSLHSYRQQAVTESRAWATAVAMLSAQVSSNPVADRDIASLDEALQSLVVLPGVQAIQVVGPGGWVVLRLVLRSDGTLLSIEPRREQAIQPPVDEADPEQPHVHGVASLLTVERGASAPAMTREALLKTGWVDVEFNYAQRMAESNRTWIAASIGTLLLIVLALWLFYLFLRRAIRPVRRLAQFSTTLASNPGETLMLRWGSREVRELGRALNWSSMELARRIDETQQKFSRLQAILDTAADAIIGVREDGTIDSINPAAERMFGRSSGELRGQRLNEFLGDMDVTRLRETIDNGMLIYSTQSRIGRVETHALRHGGTEFPVEILMGEIPNDQSIRYTCIVRDLTDMKQAEAYLALYGRVVDCTPNGISISDARSYPQSIVHVNPAFTRITGYAPQDVLGRDASILEGPETDPGDLELLSRTVRSGGEIKLTLRNHRKDGSVFHNKLTVAPVRDAQGEITHYINIIEDVSPQIEVKRKLIERTARLNATFDLSPDGFVVFDARGELITSNPAFRSMVGEVPGWCSLQRFDVWFKNLCEDFDSYRSITTAWHDRAKDTMVLAHPTRKVLEREIRRNLGGSAETFLYFRDITHQFEVDQLKSEFLATAAHELRTPLASILGFTELMLHRKYTPEQQKDLLQTVHRQGTLLSKLIQELLDLSRIEARQGKDFHIVPTLLAGIVSDALEGVSSQSLGRPVEMESLPDWRIMADASKIGQALINLLGNAFKYSPNGGHVRLDFTQEDRDGQSWVVIRVSDQGMGMTSEQVQRAFERFYRADASGNIPGTGLGLNLVKEIAEIHGGRVELTSEVGVGTVASLWLKQALASARFDTEAEAAPAI